MEASGTSNTRSAPTAAVLNAHDHTRLWLQSKLSGDWSSVTGASGLTEERLNALSRSFGSLDSMVKVRLLLAGLFVPRADRSRLQPLLAELSSQAAGSQDEWVRATAAVVGDYSGTLDMKALMAQFPLVRDTMTGLSSQLGGLDTPVALLPQMEQYMHRDINRLPAGAAAGPAAAAAAGDVAAASGRPHFRLREPPVATLAELGLGAVQPGGAGGGGGPLPPGPGLGSWLGPGGLGLSLDLKGSLGAAAAGGAESLGRRGLGGGEASMLRSRADISHSSAKDAKQGPPTPSGKAIPGSQGMPALRLSRSRSLVGQSELGPGGLPVAESPHGHLGQPPPVGLPLVPLGRRDSLQTTPRHGWTSSGGGGGGGGLGQQLQTLGSAPNTAATAALTEAVAASGAGSGAGAAAAVRSTSTADPPEGLDMPRGGSGELERQDSYSRGPHQHHHDSRQQQEQEQGGEDEARDPGQGFAGGGRTSGHEQGLGLDRAGSASRVAEYDSNQAMQHGQRPPGQGDVRQGVDPGEAGGCAGDEGQWPTAQGLVDSGACVEAAVGDGREGGGWQGEDEREAKRLRADG